jgi:hypothetical protein
MTFVILQTPSPTFIVLLGCKISHVRNYADAEIKLLRPEKVKLSLCLTNQALCHEAIRGGE